MISIRETLPTCQDLPAPIAKPKLSVLRGGKYKHERTDEDKSWYAQQLQVEHTRLTDKSVFERLAYYASCNPERDSYAGVARLARESLCSPRTVQYARRRLEAAGLIEGIGSNKGGRSTATVTASAHYRVLGRTSCAPRGAPRAPKDLKEKEGNKRTKDPSLSVSDDAQTIDRGAVEKVDIPQEVIRLPFPSKEQKQEKTPVRKKQENDPAPSREPLVFTHPRQVALLFALQRKLDYRADDGQAAVFDGLEHCDKKRILDKLLEEEQLAAALGQVEAPPPKPRAPRFNPISTAPKRSEPPSCVTGHRWSEAAEDGVQNCVACNAEQCATHRWTAPASDGVQNCVMCNAERTAERTAEVGAG